MLLLLQLLLQVLLQVLPLHRCRSLSAAAVAERRVTLVHDVPAPTKVM
jgi:hypothetical protein